jgi:hypothetical protein
LSEDFCGLVLLDSEWQSLGRGEDDSFDESLWVFKEDVSLSLRLKVVELVVVEDAVFEIEVTLEVLLFVSESDWAVVAELRQALSHHADVTVQVLHNAWVFLTLVEEELFAELLSGV